jgi:hypothetical protein
MDLELTYPVRPTQTHRQPDGDCVSASGFSHSNQAGAVCIRSTETDVE